MLVDFLDPCSTCGGIGKVESLRDAGDDDMVWIDACPSCVRGRVVSESVIEEMAEAIYHAGIPDQPDPDDVRYLARAAARVVLEHMEDNE